jgi:ribosomal protein S18 acetylase RimI-like enzyme
VGAAANRPLPADASDLEPAIFLIAGEQSRPERNVPALAEDPEGLRAELDELEVPWSETLRVVRGPQQDLVGAALVDWDAEVRRAWVLGPWVAGDDEAWDRSAKALVDSVLALVPAGIDSFELSGDVANRRMARLAEGLGWAAGVVNHALTVSRAVVRGWELSPVDGVLVRPARGSDVSAIGPLHDAEFPETYAAAGRLVERAETGEWAVLVAERSGRGVVGYAAGRVQASGDGYLDFVAVDPGERRCGVGRLLVTEVCRQLVERAPGGRVSLTVQDTRVAARALYEALGFSLDVSLVGYRPAW